MSQQIRTPGSSALLAVPAGYALAAGAPAVWVAVLVCQAVVSAGYNAWPTPAGLTADRLTIFAVGLTYLCLAPLPSLLGPLVPAGLLAYLLASRVSPHGWGCWVQFPASISFLVALTWGGYRVNTAAEKGLSALFWPSAIVGPIVYAVRYRRSGQGYFWWYPHVTYLWHACVAGILTSVSDTLVPVVV